MSGSYQWMLLSLCGFGEISHGVWRIAHCPNMYTITNTHLHSSGWLADNVSLL